MGKRMPMTEERTLEVPRKNLFTSGSRRRSTQFAVLPSFAVFSLNVSSKRSRDYSKFKSFFRRNYGKTCKTCVGLQRGARFAMPWCMRPPPFSQRTPRNKEWHTWQSYEDSQRNTISQSASHGDHERQIL